MKIVFLLVLALVLIPITIAAPIDFNSVKYDIQDNYVYVENEIIFHLDKGEEFEINLPIKYEDLSVELSGELINPRIEDNKIKLNIPKESNQLIIKYRTKDFLEESSKNFFITEFENPLEATFVFMELKLPEGSALDQPIEQGKSAYPEPKQVTSDGQRIIIRWQKENVIEGDRTAIFVTYKDGENNLVYFVLPLFTIILILGYLVLRKPKVKKEIQEKVVNKPELHLKEEEKQVVRIIERKGGKVNQSTLVTISDFSKAKMSQIIKELEERKIVKKVKKGKKNVIILKSKLLDLE